MFYILIGKDDNKHHNEKNKATVFVPEADIEKQINIVDLPDFMKTIPNLIKGFKRVKKLNS